jgi:hypothetical protein
MDAWSFADARAGVVMAAVRRRLPTPLAPERFEPLDHHVGTGAGESR